MRGTALPYSTCAYCQSLVLHGTGTPEDLGKVAALPFDVSPVQLGTRFHVDGVDFLTLGRVRWHWQDGAWNEWLLEAADGTHCWLGEAMGLFMLTAERTDLAQDPLIERFAVGVEIQLGQALQVDGHLLRAADIRKAQCMGSEGHLPFPTLPGTKLTNVDFRSAEGLVLSVQRVGGEATAWFGTIYEFADLNPRNARAIDGWALPAYMQ